MCVTKCLFRNFTLPLTPGPSVINRRAGRRCPRSGPHTFLHNEERSSRASKSPGSQLGDLKIEPFEGEICFLPSRATRSALIALSSIANRALLITDRRRLSNPSDSFSAKPFCSNDLPFRGCSCRKNSRTGRPEGETIRNSLGRSFKLFCFSRFSYLFPPLFPCSFSRIFFPRRSTNFYAPLNFS